MRTLLIACNGEIAHEVERLFRDAGASLTIESTGSAGRQAVAVGDFGAVLVDSDLPDIAATALIRHVNATKPGIPSVLVGEWSSVDRARRGFGCGADAYVAMPMDGDMLVSTVFGAAGRPSPDDVRIVTADWTLEICGREVSVDGERAHLLANEVRMLRMLAREPGRVVSRAEIFERIYGYRDEAALRAVDVLIIRARKIIAAATAGRCHLIGAVWGRGIRLAVPQPVSRDNDKSFQAEECRR